MKTKRSFRHYIRALHRDIGFLCIGLIVVYALSGIVLTYRDTDFLKREVQVERKLDPNLQPAELGRALHIRDLKVTGNEGETIHFNAGTYNKSTGVTTYTSKELPLVLEKFISLHKSASNDASHWFTTLFGVLLLFLGISSFWMFKKGTRLFKRGIYIAVGGVLMTVVFLII